MIGNQTHLFEIAGTLMDTESQDQWLQATLNHVLSGQPIENIATAWPELTQPKAYQLQRQLVTQLQKDGGWGQVYGYKAALTAEPAQQAMGIDEPIVGVLFEHAAYTAGTDAGLTVSTDRSVLLETELGFLLSKSITEPVSDDDVFDAVKECRCMVELAAPNLQQRPTYLDLIASNSASYGCIAGVSTINPEQMPLDATNISLTRSPDQSDSAELHQALAGSVMSGQRRALAWLINQVLALGYPLEAGHTLMTGSVGNMHPAEPDDYRADFGALGSIVFRIA